MMFGLSAGFLSSLGFFVEVEFLQSVIKVMFRCGIFRYLARAHACAHMADKQ